MTKDEYMTRMRELYRPNIGDDADEMTEADFVSDLAEDGWPDHQKWLDIFCRLKNGEAMTPRERECAVAYYIAGEAEPPAEFRLP